MEKVSVIIPTYRATERLSDAVESALAQTYGNYEVIVVDDNDPDSEGRFFTCKLMDKYRDFSRVRYILHDKNRKGAAARNTGISSSDGKYIAFLDDDDVYYPERLEKCVDAAEKSGADAVYTASEIYADGELHHTHHAVHSGKAWKELMLDDCFLGTGSNLFLKKECAVSLGGFDEDFVRYQDIEFMLRLLEKYELCPVDIPLVRKNMLPTNIPSYAVYKTNKELIFSKFGYLIDRLDDGEKTRFFAHHYRELFNAALASRDGTGIRETAEKLKSLGRFTPADRLKILIPALYTKYLRR